MGDADGLVGVGGPKGEACGCGGGSLRLDVGREHGEGQASEEVAALDVLVQNLKHADSFVLLYCWVETGKSEGGAMAPGFVHYKVHVELRCAYPDLGVSYDLSARCSVLEWLINIWLYLIKPRSKI